jgi:hypothetical protein
MLATVVYLALWVFIMKKILLSLSVLTLIIVYYGTSSAGNGCSSGAQAGLAGTDLEGKMDSVCDGSAFDQVPGAPNFQGRVNEAMEDVADIYKETMEKAENFKPDVDDIGDLQARLAGMVPAVDTGAAPPAGYVPPMYDPNSPCTWPREKIAEIIANPSSCEMYAEGTEARIQCDAVASETLDCTGEEGGGTPKSCAAVGMFNVAGVCYCDNPATSTVESCPSYSSCASSGQYLTPDGRCINDCTDEYLGFGSGMTCVEYTACGAGYWIGDDDYTCQCFANSTFNSSSKICECGMWYQWNQAAKNCDVKYSAGDSCPTDSSQYVQDDRMSCGCNNPTTLGDECDKTPATGCGYGDVAWPGRPGMSIPYCSCYSGAQHGSSSAIIVSGYPATATCECPSGSSWSGTSCVADPVYIGNEGDVCPTDPNQFVQSDRLTCGCNNPRTTANECAGNGSACSAACVNAGYPVGSVEWSGCKASCLADKCESEVYDQFPECAPPPSSACDDACRTIYDPDGPTYVQYGNCVAACNENKCASEVSPHFDECGVPGDTCNGGYIQNDRLTCGCDNPTTAANECSPPPACDPGPISECYKIGNYYECRCGYCYLYSGASGYRRVTCR